MIRLDDIINDIWQVTTQLERHPLALKPGEYDENGHYSPHVLDNYGGFRKIIEDTWGPEVKDLAVTRGQSIRKTYLSKLERTVGDKEYVTQQLVKALETAFTKNPIKFAAKKKAVPAKTKKPRTNVVMVSDTHFGLRIDRAEVPCNGFTWEIASRRMSKLAVETAEFKKEHRADCPELHICLGGDIIAGIIHLTDAGIGLLTDQIHGATTILTQFIEHLSQHYTRVVIHATSGNHDRMVHRSPKGAISQRYDSYATIIYRGLELAFRKNANIVFDIPKTPYCDFQVLGHRIMMLHGDTFLKTGNVAHSVPISKLTSAILAIQASAPSQHIGAVIAGHVHTSLLTTLNNGTRLIVNGCLSGTDTYAQSLGINSSQPSQTIFEVTDAFCVGDYRSVDLADADNESRYDEVIRYATA